MGERAKANCDGLAPSDFLVVLGPALQTRVHSRRVVREPRRPLQWAAGIRRGFYRLSDELQNVRQCPRVAR
jgi:hypothetical protein